MTVIWPWNTVTIDGHLFIIEPGIDAHKYVRLLVADRYGTDAEFAVTEIEIDGDKTGRITVNVRPQPVVQHIDLNVVSIPMTGSDA
jgi:hypothetical protein